MHSNYSYFIYINNYFRITFLNTKIFSYLELFQLMKRSIKEAPIHISLSLKILTFWTFYYKNSQVRLLATHINLIKSSSCTRMILKPSLEVVTVHFD